MFGVCPPQRQDTSLDFRFRDVPAFLGTIPRLRKFEEDHSLANVFLLYIFTVRIFIHISMAFLLAPQKAGCDHCARYLLSIFARGIGRRHLSVFFFRSGILCVYGKDEDEEAVIMMSWSRRYDDEDDGWCTQRLCVLGKRRTFNK